MGPSSPYYLFGAQRRYAYAWHGNAGGVPGGYRASTTRSLGLGNADMAESGYETSNAFFPYAAFNHTAIHRELPNAISDWPLVRPAGLEPHDPNGDGLGFWLWDGLSDNEKGLLVIAAGAGIVWWLMRKRARRNPAESSHARRTRKLAAIAAGSDNEHERAIAAQRLAEHQAKAPPKRPRRKASKKWKPAKRRKPARRAARRPRARKRRSSRRSR